MKRLAVALLLGSLTACGTTVPLTSQQVAQGTSTGDGLSAPSTGGASTTGSTTGLPSLPGGSTGGTGSSSTTSGSTGGTSTGGAAGGTSGTGGPSAGPTSSSTIPVKGKGWDAKKVYVGIITTSDAATGLQALGVSLNPGDEIGDARAIVADMNKHGGLFGRTVELVVKDDSSAAVLSNPSAAGQADCAYLTQDHPVIGVVNTDASLDVDSFRACFAKAHVPVVSLTTSVFDDKAAAALTPYFYNALSVSWNRLIPVLVPRLQAQSYFTGWNAQLGKPSASTKVKVGVLYGGDTASGREGPALVAALNKAGYATDSYQFSSQGDSGSAVLKFAGNGVTHVIGLDSFQFFFMTSAASQGYKPRYGITSYNAPQALLASNGDPSQLNGAVGVGWYPTIDTAGGSDAGPGTSSCLAALKAGGQTFAGKRFAEAVGLAICDGLRLGVLGAKAGGGLDPVSIRNGIVSLGASYPTGGGFRSGLSSTNFALPGAGRDLAWKPSCSCFTYSGPTFPVR